MRQHPFIYCWLTVIVVTSFSCQRHTYGSHGQSVKTELYFGLARPDGGSVSDAEWTSFANHAAAQVFKSGMSIQKAEGTWIDEKTKTMISEDSYVIMSVNKMTPQLSAAIDSLRAKYCRDFKQDAVMRVDQKVRVKF